MTSNLEERKQSQEVAFGFDGKNDESYEDNYGLKDGKTIQNNSKNSEKQG